MENGVHGVGDVGEIEKGEKRGVEKETSGSEDKSASE